MSQGQDSDSDVLKDADRLLLAAYRDASTDFPSAEVDDALRAAARRAVGARPHSPGRFRFGSWNTPLAAAATVALSATVVFMTLRDHGMVELAAPPAAGPAPSVRIHAEAPESPTQVATVPDQTSSALPRSPDAPARASAPPGRGPASSAPAASSHFIASGEVPASPTNPALPETSALPPPAALGEARQAKSESRERAPQSRAGLSSPPSEEEASTPGVLPGASLDVDSRRDEADAAIDRRPADLARKRSAPDALAIERRAQDNAATFPPEPAGVIGGAQSPPPEERVERIRGLLRAGKRADALAALAELSRAYPDYSLPADLAELAKALPAASR